MRLYCLLLFVLLPFLYSFSPASDPTTVAELQAQYRLLVDLQATQDISSTVFETRTAELQKIAQERFNLSLDNSGMKQASTVQRVNWIVSALYVAAALLALAFILPFILLLLKPFRRLILQLWHLRSVQQFVKILKKLFLLLWEPITYLMLIAALVFYPTEWMVLFVTFAFGSLISYSVYSRRKKDKKKQYSTLASWVITIVWALLAYYFDNAWIGFMTIGAFISSMGFVLFMWTGLIVIGFKEYSKTFILRLTGIMLVIMVLAGLIFHTEYIPFLTALRQPLRVYEVGLLSLVPLVYFLGLGYSAFFTYGRKAPLYKQVLARAIAFTTGYLTVAAGLLYGIGSLFWVGLFFMLWFTADLYFELIYRKINIIFSGMILALCLGAAGHWLQNNLSLVLGFSAQLGW
ncbi:MAG: hypothetical protein ACRBFS_17885 [Aureispira sp.]